MVNLHVTARTCNSSVHAATNTRTRLIDCFLRKYKQPTRALANQNAASHMRQPGRLSVRNA